MYGFIHNDLHQGNIHLKNGELIIFDFYDCGEHFNAQDVGVSIYHALWTGTSFHPESIEFPEISLHLFFSGYASKKSLPLQMVEQVYVLLQLREVFLYSIFKKTWDPKCLEDWQR
ncbi:Ser/Thr protein kinase RdoA (MazF antagonist) [Sporosarcina luteola]|nr:Ser/Thr protein kinase RdoA (MazF antagonist) [Sporosarcina luteola]